MSFNEVNRGGRSFFSHPAADDARGRGGFLGVDDKLSIHHVPFTVRGDTPVWGEFTPVLPSPISRIIGAPFDPVFVLENGMKIRCEATAPDGFGYGDAALSLVYEIPLASLPTPRADGKTELKRLEVTGGLELTLQGDLTLEEVAMGGEPRTGGVLHSISAYTPHRNNANYVDDTKTHAETGKALQIRTPELVFKSQGGIVLGRAFIRWEIQHEDSRTFIVKVADFSALVIPQDTAFIETAATLGYTTIGATNTVAFRQQCNGPWTMPEDGDIESFTVYQRVGTFLQGGGVYPDNGATPTGSALLAQTTTGLPDVDFNWNTAEMLGSATSGQLLWMVYQGSNSVSTFYDSIAGQDHRTGNAAGYSPGNMPDPMGATSLFAFSKKLSMYFTYSAAAGGLLERGMGRGIGRGIMRGF